MRFDDFGLIEPLLKAVHAEGYTQPTPIQEQAIPIVLAGKDLIGCAQTGTGKTAAFALPILQRLSAQKHGGHRFIRTLILTPTRELAAQIGESFAAYGRFTGLHHTVVFGGVRQGSQVKALKQGVDILIATPGRLLDLMGQSLIRLEHLEIFVLDEADRMLDMGFIHDIRRVISVLPQQRQTLFFSATMPRDIQTLADSILTNPERIRIAPQTPEAVTIEQWVYFVERQHKHALLAHVLNTDNVTRALVFTRTKRGADRVCKTLNDAKIAAEAIHADKTQGAREQALRNFKNGKTRVLIASDIVSRGIDVEEISHVINYDLPNEPESYIHRIGRTGRAGNKGKALSFCDMEERAYLDDIERLVNHELMAVEVHPFPSPLPRSKKGMLAPKTNSSRCRPSRGRSLMGRRRR